MKSIKKEKSWDSAWEKIFRTKEWGKYPSEELVRFVARNFYSAKDRRKIKILDLGCGIGAGAWYMAREGFDVYGVDGSLTAIKIAKKRLSSEGLRATLRVGDLLKLNYKDSQFDAVTDIAALQCNTYPNIKKIVVEIHRMLKPGGKFFATMLAEDKGWVQTTGRVNHFFTRAEIKQLFKSFHTLAIEEIVRKKENGARHKLFIVQTVK